MNEFYVFQSLTCSLPTSHSSICLHIACFLGYSEAQLFSTLNFQHLLGQQPPRSQTQAEYYQPFVPKTSGKPLLVKTFIRNSRD